MLTAPFMLLVQAKLADIVHVSHIVMMWGKEQFISHANRSFYAAGSGKAGWYMAFHT